MELNEFLTWILSGGGAGAVSYWLMEHLAFLVQVPSRSKRYMSLVLAAGLAMLGYLAAVGMGYQAEPVEVKGWLEALFSVAGVAIGLSQLIHGVRILPMKKA